ncbi:MAG: hypothetical protein IJG32_02660, partial [Selenomonadaceae bacterium]|nr:hypothetical protein [Selenomonadaceae bacterium]
ARLSALNGGASELTDTAWALLRYLQGFATIFTGLCYDIYISKGFGEVPINGVTTRQNCHFSDFSQLPFNRWSITIPPMVHYHFTVGRTLVIIIEHLINKRYGQDFLGRGNLIP